MDGLGGSQEDSVLFPVPPRHDRAGKNGWCERDPPLRTRARHPVWRVWDYSLVFDWSDELALHSLFGGELNHAKAVKNGDWNISETMATDDDHHGFHETGDCHPKHQYY